MKPHLHDDNTEVSQPAQSLIPLISFDPLAGTVILDASIAESLCGINVDKLLNNKKGRYTSPQLTPTIQELENQTNLIPFKTEDNSWTECANERSKKALSTAEREFTALGRKAARLFRKIKSQGYKTYSAQQKVAEILDLPWTQIQYAVQLHNKNLNQRYERMRDRLIFKLWTELGWTKSRIAERFNVHPKTISSWIKDIQNSKREQTK